MKNNQNLQPNDLDALIGDNHLQMMKVALPFMNASQQRLISCFVKFNELQRTVDLFEDEEVATMGICSAGENQKSTSPIEMLNTIKPFADSSEQDFIDLVINFFQGFQLAESFEESVPTSTIPKSTVSAQNAEKEQKTPPPPPQQQKNQNNPFGRVPIEQLKYFMPPEQQSRLETMQHMMSAMQQMN